MFSVCKVRFMYVFDGTSTTLIFIIIAVIIFIIMNITNCVPHSW